jgi:hypothetical protein
VVGFFIAVIALIGRRAVGGKLTTVQRTDVMRMALQDVGLAKQSPNLRRRS